MNTTPNKSLAASAAPDATAAHPSPLPYWTGTSRSVFVCNGATGHALHAREEHDYYATEPRAVELLLELESFAPRILEPACGEGHIAKVLRERGYAVTATDLIDRGYGTGGVDFLSRTEPFDGDVITNPPYRYAQQFVERALSVVPEGNKVAMFLKLTFLEGKARRALFDRDPPICVWVSSSRLNCAMNGNFNAKEGGAQAYAWFVWQRGWHGHPQIRWFN